MSGKNSKVNILVADDDADMRAWLLASLEPLGVTVDEVEDGASLLCLLADDRYSLVITDLHMPSPTGLHAAGMVRSLGIETPFLVISADHSHEDAMHDLPGVKFLAKPFSLPQLFEAIDALADIFPSSSGSSTNGTTGNEASHAQQPNRRS